ncbi:ABC transporter ATP-binding protein [Thermocoleostomius sinensis]|uniref:ATP-binding cassette domain-containing protein n=1 Tax=Thermocoleostomius sinensis A174 TaxID=2016057 RepID=A0A9E8ZGI2_9CYAN|nr:ATP-binding cassette domain-containing protein [Thermocoleostomius sinensis A174]
MARLTRRSQPLEALGMVGSAAVEMRSLTRHFGKFTAVDDLNLTVQTGEIFGLLGPNGAGKTTVIKILTTLLPPSSGQISISGLNLVRQSALVRRVIGYVPQALSADGSLTGYENLLIFAKLYDIPREQRKHRIADVLELMGLQAAAHRLVRQYSGGMIRKLEIAQAILHRPRVLFLDEPTVGLDPLARSQVWELVTQLQSNYGTTVVLTTHFLEEANYLCDRVLIMHQGQAIVTGTPSDLKASLGKPDATLDDVFIQYTGDPLMSGTNYHETSKLRRTTQRLG